MKSGPEVRGFLVRHSTGPEAREIYLIRPQLVTFDDAGEPSYFEMGEAILLDREAVVSVVFLERAADLQSEDIPDGAGRG